MGYDGTLKFDTKVDSSGFESGVSKIGSLAGSAIKTTTAIIGGASTAIVGLGAAAVKVGSEFEASMSNVAAISGATGDELDALTAKAQEMGAKTKFSASESADAFSYMAMAGWKTEDMLNGIEGIMNLAAASGEDLATTSDIVTDALTAFGLSAADSGHFADILAAASSNANTNVGLMGETFKYVAPVAGALGFSAEDTAQAIGLMANAGIKGSQAGTALRSMFTRLAKPTKEVQTAMDALNISLTDEQGNVKDLSTLMGDLREGFANCSDAEAAQYAAMIAGQEGMSGLLAIVNSSEADYNKLADAIAGSTDELTGYSAAEEMAAKQIDNLQGQVTILKSALEGFGILVYQEMDGPLKEVVKTAQDMVGQLTDAFKEGGFDGLVSAAGDVLAQIVDKIAKSGPKLINMAVNLVHSFCEGIKNADGIGESGAELIAALVEGMTQVFGDIWSTAADLIVKLVDGLQSHIPDILQTGIDVILNLINGITQALPTLIPQVVGIITQIVQTLLDNMPMILDAALQLIQGLAQGLLDSIPVLLEALPQIISSIITFIQGAIPQIIQAGVELLTSLVGALPDIIKAIVDVLPQIIEGILGAILGAIPLLIDAGIQLLTSLVDALPEIITTIVEALPQIIDSIITTILDSIPQIVDAGIKLLVALIQALPQIIVTIVDAIPKIIEGIVDGVLGNLDKIIMAGVELFVSLIENLPTIIVEIVKAVPKIIDGIVKAFGSLVGKMAEIGGNIVKGLWDGITGLASWIWDKVSGWCSDLWDGICGFFGIHSPSKEMAWVGEMLVTGLADSISDNGEDAVKEAEKLSEDVLDAFDTDPPKPTGGGGISPGLYNATRQQMEDLANDMQATVNAETGELSYDKTGQQAYEQAQAERRSLRDVNVTGSLEGDRPLEVHTNLYIDKRKFAEEITPAVNHEMYKIDSSENNRGRGN